MHMLKQLRQQAGLSQSKLADLCGLSRRTIEDIERRGDCRISTARILCDALNIRLDDFYTTDEE